MSDEKTKVEHYHKIKIPKEPRPKKIWVCSKCKEPAPCLTHNVPEILV